MGSMTEKAGLGQRPGWGPPSILGLPVAVLVSAVVVVTLFGPGGVPSASPPAVAVDLDPLRLALGWGLAGALLAVAVGIILTTDWHGPDGGDLPDVD
jgi:hypothetical protein